ncbi:MAG: branched-chain amino acid transaminase [Acidimicrobiales bacterium]
MAITESDRIWMDGKMVDWADAKIHVLTHGLHYGSGVFEGIRAYETPRGPAIFRLNDHIDRFFKSAKILLMDIPFSREELRAATKAVVTENKLKSCYLRPIAYLGYGEMGLNPLLSKTNVAIAAWPWGAYLGEEGLAKGIRVKISSWQRHDPNAIPPAVKCTGMYVNSSLAKIEAVKSGYDECILLSPQGTVSECTGENIFIVKGRRVITPPISAGALDGLTRDAIMVLAREHDFEVQEGTLLRSDLYLADEIFLTGTAAEVVPVASVDDREVGDGRPGSVTKELQAAYFDLVKGKSSTHPEWLDYVE